MKQDLLTEADFVLLGDAIDIAIDLARRRGISFTSDEMAILLFEAFAEGERDPLGLAARALASKGRHHLN